MRQYPTFVDYMADSVGTTNAWKSILSKRPDYDLKTFTREFLASDKFLVNTAKKTFLESFTTPPTLEDAVVFKADNVARFYLDNHQETDLSEFLPTYAPPYGKFWVEFDTGMDLPEIAGHRRVGVLFNGYDFADTGLTEDDPDDWRWGLEAFIYLGLDSVRAAGPFFVWRIYVRADGSLIRESLALPEFEGFGQAEADEHENWFNDAWDAWQDLRTTLNVDAAKLLRPALLTLGFLHCKNVEQVENEPTTVTKKQRKRGEKGKARFYTLDIQAMTRVLKRDGGLDSHGLGAALHICRGHFKTFTPEAPLLGRATGTFWWAPQVRGSREKGEVEKDYRVSGPLSRHEDSGSFGAEWVPLDVHSSIDDTSMMRRGEAATRGLRAHKEVLEILRRFLAERAIEPRRPRPDEPQFDLGFELADEICIVEAKSLTEQNYENQLRLGIGQLIGYRFHVRNSFPNRRVRAYLLTESEPPDTTWTEICASQEIKLIWPSMFGKGAFLR